MAALEESQRFRESLGIRALPAFLIESDGRAVLVRGVADYEVLMRAVAPVAIS